MRGEHDERRWLNALFVYDKPRAIPAKRAIDHVTRPIVACGLLGHVSFGTFQRHNHLFLNKGDERGVCLKSLLRWAAWSNWFLFCSSGPYLLVPHFLARGQLFKVVGHFYFSVANWTKCTLRKSIESEPCPQNLLLPTIFLLY